MKTETASTVRAGVEALGLDMLHPHPRNPRRKAGTLVGLCESLKAQGQLEPILVRKIDRGGYEILAGHRRVEALRVNGALFALAIVRDVPSDAEALSILLAANEQREDVDPWLEAAAVQELVKLEGSVKGAAARMGVPSVWVAQRLSLLELSPTWQQRRKEQPWSSWTPGHWAVIARLAPEAQEQLANAKAGALGRILEMDQPRVSELEELVREQLRLLGKAPFDVEDGKLVRGTPACSACPKTSQSVPGLFDDGEPVDLKSATCRDGYCWGRKAAAGVRLKISEAKGRLATKEFLEDGAEVPVVTHGYAAPKGAGPVVPQHGWTEAKKGEKGAVPVVIVSDKGGVTTGYGKVAKARPASTPANKTETPAATLARLEALFAEQVREAALGYLWDRMEKLPDDLPLERVLALLLLVGAEPTQERHRKPTPMLTKVRVTMAGMLAACTAIKTEVLAAQLIPMVEEAAASGGAWRMNEAVAEADRGRAHDAIALALGVTVKDLDAVRAKVLPSKELELARAAAPAPKRSTGKGAAAGDRDAADADAAPKGKTLPVSAKLTAAVKRKLAGRATPR